MKHFLALAFTAILMIAPGFAMAANAFIIDRGTNINTGVQSVTYSVDGQLFSVTKADLALAGVDIYNEQQVTNHLSMAVARSGGDVVSITPVAFNDFGVATPGLPDSVKESGGDRW